MNTEDVVEPFTIAIPEEDVVDLRARLQRSRWADDFGNESWSYGMPAAYLHDLVAYWLDGYDWRRHEAAMNRYPHHRAMIDGVPVHFMWVKSPQPDTIPLVLTHGWPWTFWDYRDVIGRLTDRADMDDPAFDLVIPSLPGYGFSRPLRTTGVGAAETADLWVKLMTALGYEQFGAVGGDWGAFVTANLAHAHADRLVGAYLSLGAVPGLDLSALGPEDYDEDEQEWLPRWRARMATARAHSAVNTDAPQTLGWALNDSPVGLAAWIVERRRLWSHWEDDFEAVFSKDFLLTNVSIYWFTQTAHSAARFYAETLRAPWRPRHQRTPALEAPVGVGVFPYDLLLLPRRVVAQHANLVHWSVMPRGGHFAPAEQPQLLSADIRAFFGGLRRG